MRGKLWICAIGSMLALGAAPIAVAQQVSAPNVDSLALRGLAQAQFNTTSADGEPDSEWLVRRARIGARAYIAGWIQGFVEGDFGRGRARLTDGWVNLGFDPRVGIRIGQFKVPFDALELTSSRRLPVVERDPLPRGANGFSPNGLLDDLGFNSRDIGAMWTGSWPSATVQAGFFNGSGDNDEEDDDGKQVAARVTGKLAGTLRLAGAWSALRVSDPPAAEDSEWYNAFEVALTGGEYGEPGWQGLAQVMVGDNYDPAVFGDDDASFVALQGIAAYHVPLYGTPYLIGVAPAARIGWTRIEDGSILDDDELIPLDEDPETFVGSFGANLFWRENVVSQFNIDVSDADPGGSDVSFRFQTGFAF